MLLTESARAQLISFCADGSEVTGSEVRSGLNHPAIVVRLFNLKTTMSSMVTSVLDLTIGLLWNKVRDHTANELREGDPTDEKCRQLIVRELDDIKSMIDGIVRNNLLSSVSFLKEGVQLLNFSLDEATDEEAVTSVQEQRDEFTGSTHGGVHNRLKHQEDSYFEEAMHELSRVIASSDITSKERLSSAKSSFSDARREATRAFNNKALNTEDRILASKLRVISRILESLEDPDAAADACKLYLEELHDMHAVQEMFSVHLRGGIKSLFNKKKRLEMMASVIIINCMLCNFVINFAKRQLDLCSWPRLRLPQRDLHPLVDVETQKIMRKFGVRAPNQFVFSELIYPTAADLNHLAPIMKEIPAMGEDRNSVEVLIDKSEIHFSLRKTKESPTNERANVLHAVTMDKENDIYAVVSPTPNTVHFNLYVSDAKGNIKAKLPLSFLTIVENVSQESLPLFDDHNDASRQLGPSYGVELVVNKDKDIILGYQSRIYVCDSICGQLKYSFDTVDSNDMMSICDKNEIISAKYRGSRFYFYTKMGELKCRSKVARGQEIYDLIFHYISKKVFILTRDSQAVSQLECYSCFGELLQTFPLHLPIDFRALQVFPEGPVAVIHEKGFVLI